MIPIQIGDLEYPYFEDYLIDTGGNPVDIDTPRPTDRVLYIHLGDWSNPLEDDEIEALRERQEQFDQIVNHRNKRKIVREVEYRVAWTQTVLWGFVAAMFGSLLGLTIFQVLIGF